MRIQLLLLDHRITLPRGLKRSGIDVDVTEEPLQDMRDTKRGIYVASPHSIMLAAGATPDRYDAVVIGDNAGTGIRKAMALPESMHDRTMIVWTRYEVDKGLRYTAIGITRMGQRYSLAGNIGYDVADFLQETADSLQLSSRALEG